ncbi:MAG: UvrD-helicase domain-containing protein [Deltaproteobacteria bacterium]|nr:UvrD-helicase domain-containing protein [Deltaproteobacteria bacterium]
MSEEEVPGHLQGLNPEQHDAVTTLEGALLVLAGAGSGKTRVLTRRIAHLLHTGVDPERILAVTFTNKAAQEMKERVQELVGEPGKKVWVSTFHSTCGRILRKDIEPLGWSTRFSIYDDDDQARIIRQILKDLGYDPKEVPPKSILSRIDGHKNRGETLADLRRLHRVSPGDALLRVWGLYDEALRAADALDFNDLIGHTLRLFREHPEVAEQWSERFAYVLVDEYQDTNSVQYQLLRILTQTHGNLAVVGDDDQSIYGFRGADPDIIRRFKADHPQHKMIAMEQNYRSSANILTVANFVVEQNSVRERKTLRTAAAPGPVVRLLVEETPFEEAEKVADLVERLHRRKDLAYGKMAIIYRTNATSRLFEAALARRQVPHRVVGGRKFYERREVRDMLAYLRLIVNPADDAAFLRVVNVPSRGIGTKTVSELREAAATRGEPLLASAKGTALGETVRDKAMRGFVGLIEEATSLASELEPVALLAHLLEATGYREMVEEENEASRKESLEALAQDAQGAERIGDTHGPLDRLQRWLDQTALAGQDEEIPDGGQVALMTVHNAKGLEYPVVFVVQMVEDQFPHAKSKESKASIEEERRLAYVAFTRAMERLYITRARRKALGFGERFGKGKGKRATEEPALASRFIHVLPPEACKGDVPQVVTEDPAKTRLESLRGFLRGRAEVEAQPSSLESLDPLEVHTLRELESLEQLQEGVRVVHPAHGVGTIQRVDIEGTLPRICLSFGGERARWVPVAQSRLKVVVE